MGKMPREPEAFGETVLRILHRSCPDSSLELAGPMSLVIDGRRLDLDNLYRMVLNDPDRGVEIVENYLDRMIEGDTYTNSPLPLCIARSRIMPRIQPESIFNRLDKELVAHVPFVNGTVIVFVMDLPEVTVSISTEQMIRWGLQPDDLEEISRHNLGRYAPKLNLQIINSSEGGRAAILSQNDGYDAARLLLGHLYRKLAPEMEGDFYVATPSRDMFVAMTCDPENFVDRLRRKVEREYRRLPYPITNELFIVTRDGVAGTAA